MYRELAKVWHKSQSYVLDQVLVRGYLPLGPGSLPSAVPTAVWVYSTLSGSQLGETAS